MSVKNIVIEPDPILRKKSKPVEKVNSEIRKLLDEMLETMYAAPGIGLAAVQVGILSRLIVIDISKDDEKKNPLFLINPEINFKSKNTSIHEEGCLSLPGHYAEIERPAECVISYIDYNGNKKQLNAKGLLSTCIQHEIDHLNGVLFIDYLSKLKKDMIIKKLIKQKKDINKT
tara:strand:+ start:49 stop:567 length:519 start_codon:yes stop_codon:yes gene_type:complete